jgi:glutaredoxin-related protein
VALKCRCLIIYVLIYVLKYVLKCVLQCVLKFVGDILQTAIALVTGHKTSPQVFVRGLFVGGATECLHLLETGETSEKYSLNSYFIL